MKPRIMLPVALGMLAAMVTLPSSASSTHMTYSFPFTLIGGPLPDFCPMLPTGFEINGSIDGTDIITTSVNSAGVTHVEVNSLELGSATDTNGATYVVNYHNHTGYDIQPGGFPVTLLQNDHFNLVGAGVAGNLQVHFVITVTFLNSSDPGTVTVVNKHGNAFACDVI
jgi:hypothetical protein